MKASDASLSKDHRGYAPGLEDEVPPGPRERPGARRNPRRGDTVTHTSAASISITPMSRNPVSRPHPHPLAGLVLGHICACPLGQSGHQAKPGGNELGATVTPGCGCKKEKHCSHFTNGHPISTDTSDSATRTTQTGSQAA